MNNVNDFLNCVNIHSILLLSMFYKIFKTSILLGSFGFLEIL